MNVVGRVPALPTLAFAQWSLVAGPDEAARLADADPRRGADERRVYDRSCEAFDAGRMEPVDGDLVGLQCFPN